ncbi:carbohydrate ABC transporter permease [Candidatus Poribacteria bacterium]|nr:MAG: carbohydrate ABC transporter permease [Candidatus Poribacteria bacterium]
MREEKLTALILTVLLSIAAALYLFPVYWMVSTATKTRLDALSIPPKWIYKPTLEHFKAIFSRGSGSSFAHQLLNSFIVSFASTGLVTIFGSLAGYAFSRFPLKAKDDLLFFILSTRMLPPIVVIIPLAVMYRSLGLFDTRLGLIIAYTVFNLSFAVWMMKSFVDEIPKEYEEAAMVDGYSRLRAFLKFVLPEMRTGMVATAIFSLITSWNEFTFALLLTADKARTAPPSIAQSMGVSGTNWGYIAAGSLLLVIPVAAFTFILRKHLLRGFTFGAIKG